MIEFPLWAMVVICIFAVIGGITALVILYFLVIYPIVDMIRNYSDYKKFYYRYNYRTDDLEMLDILKRNLKNK